MNTLTTQNTEHTSDTIQLLEIISRIANANSTPIQQEPKEKPLPRVRGIKEAVAELKLADPNTPITEHMLRRLVLSKAIPSIKIGCRYYVNLEVLTEHFLNGFELEDDTPEYGTIRAIKE